MSDTKGRAVQRLFTPAVVIAISVALATPPAAAEVDGSGAEKQEVSALTSASGGESVLRDRKPPNMRGNSKSIRWKACAAEELARLDCARLKVPRDWNQPNGPQFSLKMYRLKSKSKRSKVIGSLFTNPGGPGFSGVTALGILKQSKKLRKNFDLVAWDPRGVPQTDPVLKDCPSTVGAPERTRPRRSAAPRPRCPR